MAERRPRRHRGSIGGGGEPMQDVISLSRCSTLELVPELPDVAIYIEALEQRILGARLERVRLSSPFLLRSFDPPLRAAEGRSVLGLRRLGKRIVLGLEGDLFLVLHLMIAGRLRWQEPGARSPGQARPGRLRLLHGNAPPHRSGHQEARRSAPGAGRGGAARRSIPAASRCSRPISPRSARRSRAKTTPLKRALTDPRLFSGIGNAYCGRDPPPGAALAGAALPSQLDRGGDRRGCSRAARETLQDVDRASARRRPASGFPGEGHRLPARDGRARALSASRARCAARRCSASSTPRTRPTTARAARRAVASSPTARCHACSTPTGRGLWKSWRSAGPGNEPPSQTNNLSWRDWQCHARGTDNSVTPGGAGHVHGAEARRRVHRDVLAGPRGLRQRRAGGRLPQRGDRAAWGVLRLRSHRSHHGLRASATFRAVISTQRCRSACGPAAASHQRSWCRTSIAQVLVRILGGRRRCT